MIVFFNLTCWSEDVAFGATLFLRTVRTGFPTASLVIAKNRNFPIPASVEETVDRFALEDGNVTICDLREFCHAAPFQEHGAFIRGALDLCAEKGVRDVFFSDTDMVFWESLEDLALPAGKLYGGQYVPELLEPVARMAPRVHPSLFMVPDPAALLADLWGRNDPAGYLRPFEGWTFHDNGERRMFDVLASLYALLPDRAHLFTEAELARYEHLMCGTYLDRLDGTDLSERSKAFVREAHRLAKEDPEGLRGYWKRAATASA